jgi:hypothetical protein
MKLSKVARVAKWEKDHVRVGENFTCAMLIATGVFHQSRYGRDFSRKFRTGDIVKVTVERHRRIR